MDLTVNDKPVQLPQGSNLSELLHHLNLKQPHLAVAVNDEVIPRARHSSFKLQNRDKIIIVEAVGGG